MFKYTIDTYVLRYICYTYILHMKYRCIVQHMFNMCDEIGGEYGQELELIKVLKVLNAVFYHRIHVILVRV